MDKIYKLERFGSLFLPDRNVTLDMSAGDARSSFVALPDGYYRSYGAERAPSGLTVITKRCTLKAETPAALLTALMAFKAKKRSVDRLYRRRVDGQVEWCWAEFTRLRDTYAFGPSNAVDLDFGWTQKSTSWYGNQHGEDWELDSGALLDSGLVLDQAEGDTFVIDHLASPNIFTVTNAGNATIRNAILLITAGSAAINEVSIGSTGPDSNNQAQLLYTGTVDATKSLRIDAGSQAVEHNNPGGYVGDYEHFDLEDTHIIAGWLQFDPGTTTLQVSIDSTQDATLTVTFSDGWES